MPEELHCGEVGYHHTVTANAGSPGFPWERLPIPELREHRPHDVWIPPVQNKHTSWTDALWHPHFIHSFIHENSFPPTKCRVFHLPSAVHCTSLTQLGEDVLPRSSLGSEQKRHCASRAIKMDRGRNPTARR